MYDLRPVLIIAAAMAFAHNAHAQCLTYLYTGAPFTLVTTAGTSNGIGVDIGSVVSPLTGSVTLAAPLPANGVTTAVSNWNFAEPFMYPLTNQGIGFYATASFTFTTSNGVITNWSVSMDYTQGPATADRDEIIISSTVNGDTVTVNMADPTDGIAPGTIQGSSASPGAWVCQTTYTAAMAPAAPAPTPPPPVATPSNTDTVASCATATPGTAWAAGAWLPCKSSMAYVAQPVAGSAPVSDMRCPVPPATGACVYSWQIAAGVKSTDQIWVKTAAKPNGTWVNASTLVGL
jgi:hypothetical protein